jgi:hypothetical protein
MYIQLVLFGDGGIRVFEFECGLHEVMSGVIFLNSNGCCFNSAAAGFNRLVLANATHCSSCSLQPKTDRPNMP